MLVRGLRSKLRPTISVISGNVCGEGGSYEQAKISEGKWGGDKGVRGNVGGCGGSEGGGRDNGCGSVDGVVVVGANGRFTSI